MTVFARFFEVVLVCVVFLLQIHIFLLLSRIGRIRLGVGFLFTTVQAAFYTVETLAGVNSNNQNQNQFLSLPAKYTQLSNPFDVWINTLGDSFIADYSSCHVLMISGTTGVSSVYAGVMACGNDAGDGSAANQTSISSPSGIWGDSVGNIYFTEQYKIRKVTVEKIIETIGGVFGQSGFNGNNIVAKNAYLSGCGGLWGDSTGQTLFVADSNNHRIRNISLVTGLIGTYAGDGNNGYTAEETGSLAHLTSLSNPQDVWGDTQGNLFIADTSNNLIRRVDVTTKLMTIYAGTVCEGYQYNCMHYNGEDLLAFESILYYPVSIVCDQHGNLFIADSRNFRVRMVNHASLIMKTIAGNGVEQVSGDGGLGVDAAVQNLKGLALDSSGNLFILDSNVGLLRKLEKISQIIETVVGYNQYFSGDGKEAILARMNNPRGIWQDSVGNTFILDAGNFRVRRVDAVTGIIHTIAGNGELEYRSVASEALKSPIGSSPTSLWGDTDGNLFIVDQSSYQVFRYDARHKTIAPYVGSSNAPVNANLFYPSGIYGDNKGTLYISEYYGCRIIKINTNENTFIVFAGIYQSCSYYGDNIDATSARLSGPKDLWVNTGGDVFVVDSRSYRIRKITKTFQNGYEQNIITTIAGNGYSGYTYDYQYPLSAAVPYVVGLSGDTAGNLYYTENNYYTVKMISAATNTILTIAGRGNSYGDNVDSLGASLNNPYGMLVTKEGNILFIESNRVRQLKPSASFGIYHVTMETVVVTEMKSIENNVTAANSEVLVSAMGSPSVLFVDAYDFVYFYDPTFMVVRVLDPITQEIRVFAGNVSVAGDTVVRVRNAVGSSIGTISGIYGNNTHIYLSDSTYDKIRIVSSESDMTILQYTTQRRRKLTDETRQLSELTEMFFNAPGSIWIDNGNNLYVIEVTAHRVSRIDHATKLISYVAYNVYSAKGLWGDNNGNLYLSENNYQSVWKINIASGNKYQIAGSSNYCCEIKRRAPYPTQTYMAGLGGLWGDDGGNLFIVETGSSVIRVQNLTSNLLTVAAGMPNQNGYTGDAANADEVSLNSPLSISGNNNGYVYISDSGNGMIRRMRLYTLTTSYPSSYPSLSPTQPTVSPTVQPTQPTSRPSSKPTSKPTSHPTLTPSAPTQYPTSHPSAAPTSIPTSFPTRDDSDLAPYDPSAQVYHVIHTIAGNDGTLTGDGDVATNARFQYPQGIFQDTNGDTYITDYGGHRIRKITKKTGKVSTIAGNGDGGHSEDGTLAVDANIVCPGGVWVDHEGNVYYTDQYNYEVRVIFASTGRLGTIRVESSFYQPSSLFGDSTGHLYVADTYHHTIVKVYLKEKIYWNTGTPSRMLSEKQTEKSEKSPESLDIARESDEFFTRPAVSAEQNNENHHKKHHQKHNKKQSISALEMSGDDDDSNNFHYKSEIVAGMYYNSGFYGDKGNATSAYLYYPRDVWVDTQGAIFIADSNNNRIRKVDTSGIIDTYVGRDCTYGYSSCSGDSADGTLARQSYLSSPYAVSGDSDGKIYIADSSNYKIKAVDPKSLKLFTVAGSSNGGFSGDGGVATAAGIGRPVGLFIDKTDNILFVDNNNAIVRKVSQTKGNIISTFAGGSRYSSGDGGPATSASMYGPSGVWVDSLGNTYLSDASNYRIRKINRGGIIATVAGTGASNSNYLQPSSTPATSVIIGTPAALWGDSVGNVYFIETYNYRIKRYSSADEKIKIIGGNIGSCNSCPYPKATSTSFSSPSSIYGDSNGNLYVADRNNHIVRNITLKTNAITTAAGMMYSNGFNGDGGEATSTYLYYPSALYVDSTGDLYIADSYNYRIRKVTKLVETVEEVTIVTYLVSTIAGYGSNGNADDGTLAIAAPLSSEIASMWGDSANRLYYADYTDHMIRMIDLNTGLIHNIAGVNGLNGYNGDGMDAKWSYLYYPSAISGDKYGAIVIADSSNRMIRKITTRPETLRYRVSIKTIVGRNRVTPMENVPALEASFQNPMSIWGDSANNVFVNDYYNYRIRRINGVSRNVTTVMGNGDYGYTNDGYKATSGSVEYPQGIWGDIWGNVYFLEKHCFLVRVIVNTTQTVKTIAGRCTFSGFNGNNIRATSANLNEPNAIHGDSVGNIYIVDRNNYIIRKISTSTGIISTVAGTPSSKNDNGFWSSEGSAATSVSLSSGVYGVWSDSNGDVYATDNQLHMVYKVSRNVKTISRFVGRNGGENSYSTYPLCQGYYGDFVPATSACLNSPQSLSGDNKGSLIFADTANNRVRKVDGENKIIETVLYTERYTPEGLWVGVHGDVLLTGHNYIYKINMTLPADYNKSRSTLGYQVDLYAGVNVYYGGDGGPAEKSRLNQPNSVWVDINNNVYIGDSSNYVIRRIDGVTGIITTVVGVVEQLGNPLDLEHGEAPATSVGIRPVAGLAGDNKGLLYFSQPDSGVIGVLNTLTGVEIALPDHQSLMSWFYFVSGVMSLVWYYERDTSGNNDDFYNDDHPPILDDIIYNTNNTDNQEVPFDDMYYYSFQNDTEGGSNQQTNQPHYNFNIPVGLWCDTIGDLFIAVESDVGRVKQLQFQSRHLKSIAGYRGTAAVGNNFALRTSLSLPRGLWGDTGGNLFIADTGNNVVRKVVLSDGTISTIAGNSFCCTIGNHNAATSTYLNRPTSMWGDSVGNLFISDRDHSVIRMVNLTSGYLLNIAGNGEIGFNGDKEKALDATLDSPWGIYGDSQGHVFIADTGNNRVRVLNVVPLTSAAPTVQPSQRPTQSMAPSQPTLVPTVGPSQKPTTDPTRKRKLNSLPSLSPSIESTRWPTQKPSCEPSLEPSHKPSHKPSFEPTTMPSIKPSQKPSIEPSYKPTYSPSNSPSSLPSTQPSTEPSSQPSQQPLEIPTKCPSSRPSQLPTSQPSTQPTIQPSTQPSIVPSNQPSVLTSLQPFTHPSGQPSTQPSSSPSSLPSSQPSYRPTQHPVVQPSCQPTSLPSNLPTLQPNTQPTTLPSVQPTTFPTIQPSRQPTSRPTFQPMTRPSASSTSQPTWPLSSPPSSWPTRQPIIQNSSNSAAQPVHQPTIHPSHSLTCDPTRQPSTQPLRAPTTPLSLAPTAPSTSAPITQPIIQPTTTSPPMLPSIEPTISKPPATLSITPSVSPSISPTINPSVTPSITLSVAPTITPSVTPSSEPTITPSLPPSTKPTITPSFEPSTEPTKTLSSMFSSIKPTVPSFTPTRKQFPQTEPITVYFPGTFASNCTKIIVALPLLRLSPVGIYLRYDGFYDVEVGVSQPNSVNYIVNGQTQKRNAFNLLSMSDGFIVSPAVSYDYSGRSVSNAGDINGDGFDDLIIGVPYAARCYVLFGTTQGFVNMTDGFTIFGQASSMIGWSVSDAGDVNNDTFADIIIGAPYGRDQSQTTSGASYVIYGKQNGFVDIHLETGLSSAQGFVIYGATQSELLGLSVSSAGDVNNDGLDDVIIGALKATSSYRGGAYVVYGTNTSRSIMQLNSLGTSEGYSMSGPIWSYSGYSVSGAGDVNGDGFDDMLIGSVPFKTTFGTQMTYLVYGSNDATFLTLSLSALTLQEGVVISGGGVVVRGVGDINHDGYDDVTIGSNYGFNGGGFILYTQIKPKTYQAPTMLPVTLPMTSQPSRMPTREPTTSPSKRPSRLPSIRPTLTPTEKQTGPSEPPTEAPTGPTSTPTSIPTISTKQPTSSLTTSQPTSQPTLEPTPTSQPIVTTEPPTQHPTVMSESPTPQITMRSATLSPTVKKPSFRSRNPIFFAPSARPTDPRQHTRHPIVKGGNFVRKDDTMTNYIIATSVPVYIFGQGSSEGDIFTVLPHVNGSLYIEIFNNISDKLNLTSDSTIHSMSDLVITSGSVIITFLTTGQRIRLANLSPLDISENNFIFHMEPWVDSPTSLVQFYFIIVLSNLIGGSVLSYIAYVIWKQYRRIFKEGTIKHNDKATLLFVDLELSNSDLLQQLNEDINHTLFWKERDSSSVLDDESFEIKSKESIDHNSSILESFKYNSEFEESEESSIFISYSSSMAQSNNCSTYSLENNDYNSGIIVSNNTSTINDNHDGDYHSTGGDNLNIMMDNIINSNYNVWNSEYATQNEILPLSLCPSPVSTDCGIEAL